MREDRCSTEERRARDVTLVEDDLENDFIDDDRVLDPELVRLFVDRVRIRSANRFRRYTSVERDFNECSSHSSALVVGMSATSCIERLSGISHTG